MRANKCLLNGRSLDNRISINAWIRDSITCLLYRTKFIPVITSRNPVSPFKTMVVDFENLIKDYLIEKTCYCGIGIIRAGAVASRLGYIRVVGARQLASLCNLFAIRVSLSTHIQYNHRMFTWALWWSASSSMRGRATPYLFLKGLPLLPYPFKNGNSQLRLAA